MPWLPPVVTQSVLGNWTTWNKEKGFRNRPDLPLSSATDLLPLSEARTLFLTLYPWEPWKRIRERRARVRRCDMARWFSLTASNCGPG